ncbi:MAG: TonB-dependent receptor plug domain-containing protein, partial [Gemmatimonadetes bacterium]|nr:TonB-dependent receptor plug domain-containing protein [Gemmatimonadota bacterium]
ILLRGPTTITGTQDPLIIIDGVITDNTLADIGSLDVESIEIVKGAAASSLYGSRAQNGVVQIRTKRGQNLRVDQSRVILRSEYGHQSIEGSVPLTQAHWFETDASGNIIDDTGAIVTDMNTHTEVTGNQIPQGMWHEKKYPSNIQLYDHLDQFFTPGTYLSEYAAVEGRTGSTNYRASFTYQDEQGVISDFNEGATLKGFRLNVDHQVRDGLNIGLSTYYAQADQEDIGGSPFYALAHVNPFVDLLRRDATTIGLPHCPEQGCLVNVPDPFNQEENPLYSMEMLDNWDHRGRFLGSGNIVWSPLTWFELEGNFSLDRSDYFQSDVEPRGYETEQYLSQGVIEKDQRISNDVNASVTAAINRVFGDLTTRTRLRYLMEDQHYERFWVEGISTQAYGVPVLDNTATFDGGSSIQDVRSEGYFFISALDYKGKYMGDFLVRRDGSSLFGPEERWQTYYRASGAWRLAQEDWWPSETINEFKLRYSIGTAGGRPRFASQYETYSVSSSGIFPRTLGNVNLKPELTTEQEAGLEVVLFNKVSAGALYAWSTTEDQLLQQPLLSPVGFTSQWVNGGDIESNTFEAYVETALVDRPDMTWTSRLNFDRTRQKITSLNIPPYRTGYFYVREGEVLGTFYGDRWAATCADLHAGIDCSQFQVNDDNLLVYVGTGNSYTDGRANDLWFTEADLIDAEGVTHTYKWGQPIKSTGIDFHGNETTFLYMGNTTPDFN